MQGGQFPGFAYIWVPSSGKKLSLPCQNQRGPTIVHIVVQGVEAVISSAGNIRQAAVLLQFEVFLIYEDVSS